MKKVDKHIFVCTNFREGDRKSCGEKGLEIRSTLVASVLTSHPKINIRVNKSGCLGMCKLGPALVIYPQKTWYQNVKVSDCQEILEKSILENKVIARLEIKDANLED